MPFDVLVHITEDSLRGQVIQQIADEQQVTPETVIEQIIDAGISERVQRRGELPTDNTPAELLLGLFSSPDDAELMDEVTAMAYEGRRLDSTRNIGL